MSDSRIHYVKRSAVTSAESFATACGIKALGRFWTVLAERTDCALCQSSDSFIAEHDRNTPGPLEVQPFMVVRNPVTKDYDVIGEDPPVATLARVGSWVYLRAAAKLEREAYEKLRLAAAYRLGVEAMREHGD